MNQFSGDQMKGADPNMNVPEHTRVHGVLMKDRGYSDGQGTLGQMISRWWGEPGLTDEFVAWMTRITLRLRR